MACRLRVSAMDTNADKSGPRRAQERASARNVFMHTCRNYYYYYYAIDPNVGQHSQAPIHYVNAHTCTPAHLTSGGAQALAPFARCPYTFATHFAYKRPQRARSITRPTIVFALVASCVPETSVLSSVSNIMYSMCCMRDPLDSRGPRAAVHQI